MFRFTIRELLLLTVIAGIAVAWICDHHRMARKVDSLRYGLDCALEFGSLRLDQRIGLTLPDGEMVQSKNRGGGSGMINCDGIFKAR